MDSVCKPTLDLNCILNWSSVYSRSLPIHTMVEKEGKAQSLFPQADRDRLSDVVQPHLNLLRSSGDSSPHKVLFSSSPVHHTLSRLPSEPKTAFNSRLSSSHEPQSHYQVPSFLRSTSLHLQRRRHRTRPYSEAWPVPFSPTLPVQIFGQKLSFSGPFTHPCASSTLILRRSS